VYKNDDIAQVKIINNLTINVCGPNNKLSHFGSFLTIDVPQIAPKENNQIGCKSLPFTNTLVYNREVKVTLRLVKRKELTLVNIRPV
jgi:hypothetical protein